MTLPWTFSVRLVAGAVLAFNFAASSQILSVRGPMVPGYRQPALYINLDPLSATPYAPSQIRHAYGIDQVLTGGTDGTGQVIGIVDAFGDASIQHSFSNFCFTFNLPITTLQIIGNNTGGNSGWALETALDVEWAHAIAPGATIVLSVANSNSDVDLLAAIDAAVKAGATVISMSWGGSEFTGQTNDDVHFNVPGVTFTASSGDSGESTGVEWPAVSPYVLGVGGTSLFLDASGNQTSPQSAWSGSGGGLSTIYARPSWQSGWFQNGWSASRGVPDVAYVADPNTGMYVYDQSAGGWFQVGGTSAGAPQWAALIALANELRAGAGTLTSPASALYALAQGTTTAPFSVNASYFFDVTQGNNGPDTDDAASFPYDLVTGVGTPIVSALLPALAGGGSDFALGMTPPSQTINPGAGTSYTVTVTPSGSFSGSVYLQASGLPAGASGSFSPNPVTGGSGTSTLTLTTTAGTSLPGSYTVTVTGTNGALSHQASASLMVNTPDFSISAGPAAVTAKQGTSAQFTATISPLSGFVGSVNLSVSGLPAGATPGFVPNPVTGGSGTSTLTITTTGGTPLGKYPLTITGTAGLMSHSAMVTLTVSAPNFALSISPMTANVIVGAGTNFTVTVTPQGAYTRDVTLSLSGLPTGASSSFTINPITGGSGTSTLNVTTTSAVAPGKYSLIVTGSDGTITHTVKATLNIPMPDFTISVSPSSRTITHGNSTTYTAKITPKNGFTGTVLLSASGLPSGASALFNPPSITASGSSTLTVSTSVSTPPGTNTFTITGTSGALSHSKTPTLIVN